ncbi:hypothetical protein DFJ74DRAFT_673095 [Hyaloraphidium curvatum]|nr:hypothetical protein DFJ74DRAFT_673095 [Hyaloraphidium curvatum]
MRRNPPRTTRRTRTKRERKRRKRKTGRRTTETGSRRRRRNSSPCPSTSRSPRPGSSSSPRTPYLESLDIRPDYAGSAPTLSFGDVSFRRLRTLSVQQPLTDIFFVKEHYPAMESIFLEQYRSGGIHMDLPRLTYFSAQHWMVDDPHGFGPSLSRCPKLETVNCYKLWGLGVGSRSRGHRLALPSLEELDLYRSDDLGFLEIWAPRLRKLNLQACYGIERVDVLGAPPEGYADYVKLAPQKASRYIVNFINTSVPAGNVVRNPRCRKVFANDEDDEFGDGSAALQEAWMLA